MTAASGAGVLLERAPAAGYGHRRMPMDADTPDPDALPDEEAAMPYDPGADAAGPEVLVAFERALLDRAGVVGVGLGNDPTGADALVVYLRHADAAVGLPREFEGYPVVTRTVGDVEAY